MSRRLTSAQRVRGILLPAETVIDDARVDWPGEWVGVLPCAWRIHGHDLPAGTRIALMPWLMTPPWSFGCLLVPTAVSSASGTETWRSSERYSR